MSLIDLAPRIGAARQAPRFRVEGRIRDVIGHLLEVEGIDAPIGSELEVCGGARGARLEVLGFRGPTLLAASLDGTHGFAHGARVRLAAPSTAIPVGDGLLGRVIDPFGRPLDDGRMPVCTDRAPLQASPPAAMKRQPIEHLFDSGIRAIDALLPLGRGQRIGLFAGAGVGKSTLLGMMCRNAKVDVVVVGLIGERGRELGDFVRNALGPEGLKRSVLVAATSDTPPLVRARGALAATAIAEHYRRQGLDVLLVMDSLTRFAMALREVTLAAGEPPLTKGYTPSVFAALPSLLERAGTGERGQGSITAIYTVLVEGDDMSDPVVDATKAVLDGHILLARELADRGVFPAIDVLRSISRVALDVAPPEQMKLVSRLRELMAVHEEARDLIRIGAYVPGSDKRIDAARAAAPRIEALIKQRHDENVARDAAIADLRALALG